MILEGNIVNVVSREVFSGTVEIINGRIHKIEKNSKHYTNYILPGLIDAHVHIESSMTTPSRFSKMVVPRGTVAVVSDPHEIANVMGVKGVDYMIKDGESVPMKFFFGVPSCVPATDFETSGASINIKDIEDLFERGAYFMAEMMNFPGVIFKDEMVHKKLMMAKKYNKPIDGHAPGLVGDDMKRYVEAGITTDHECSTIEEAVGKINMGMKVQIREGSAARNFEALHPLITQFPNDVMLCTDDSHPDLILEKGHIDRLIRLGLSKGYNIFDMYQAAVINPKNHYQLPVGLLQKGDPADMIVVDNLTDFNVLATYIDGEKVAEKGVSLFDLPSIEVINNFECTPITTKDIEVRVPNKGNLVKVIKAEDGELLTGELLWEHMKTEGSVLNSDLEKDYLKIVVINRYKPSPPVVGFINGFALKGGAMASSVAHDSHNIVAIGSNDEDLVKVINVVIHEKGGIAALAGNEINCLPLPVGGIMSDNDGGEVAEKYSSINQFVARLGVGLKAPFMILAFMPLLVIPNLKIGDKGLFDVNNFNFTSLFVECK